MNSHAFSFCDCMEKLAYRNHTLPKTVEYIYVGSYFCDRYFLYTPEEVWQLCLNKAADASYKTVLVIPLPGQSLLQQVCDKVTELVNTGKVCELVVNDPGMLRWCGKRFPEMPLWSGRLMSKDIRDPRYNMEIQTLDRYELVSGGTMYGVNIRGVEADPIFPLKVKQSSKCRLAVHTPYAYISASRYCEFGSVSLPLDKKFRLDTACGRQCISSSIKYRNKGLTFYKVGRAILTDQQNMDFNSLEDIRIIHTSEYDWSNDEITDSCQ